MSEGNELSTNLALMDMEHDPLHERSSASGNLLFTTIVFQQDCWIKGAHVIGPNVAKDQDDNTVATPVTTQEIHGPMSPARCCLLNLSV